MREGGRRGKRRGRGKVRAFREKTARNCEMEGGRKRGREGEVRDLRIKNHEMEKEGGRSGRNVEMGGVEKRKI